MATIKNMTKRERNAYTEYKRSTASTLWEVYGTWSRAKEQAFDYCRRLCYEHGGHDLRIITANTFTFTAGFEFTAEDGRAAFMYITKSYDTPVYIG